MPKVAHQDGATDQMTSSATTTGASSFGISPSERIILKTIAPRSISEHLDCYCKLFASNKSVAQKKTILKAAKKHFILSLVECSTYILYLLDKGTNANADASLSVPEKYRKVLKALTSRKLTIYGRKQILVRNANILDELFAPVIGKLLRKCKEKRDNGKCQLPGV